MSDPQEAALIAEVRAAAKAARARPPRVPSPTAELCDVCLRPYNHWIVNAHYCSVFDEIEILWQKTNAKREKHRKALCKLREDNPQHQDAARDADTVDYMIRRLHEAGCELAPAVSLNMERLRLNRIRDWEEASERNEKLEKAMDRARNEESKAQAFFESTLILRHFGLMEKYGRNAVRATRLIGEIVDLEPEQQQEEEGQREKKPDLPAKKEEEERGEGDGTLASAVQPVVPGRRAGGSTYIHPPAKEEEEEEMGTISGAVQPAVPERRAAEGSRVAGSPVKKEEEEEAMRSVNAVAPGPDESINCGKAGEDSAKDVSQNTAVLDLSITVNNGR
ncbi:hypothetical protein CkaCkLH20_05134 [Colletotrichum karsti]|uniref:Uncharacterized protein n=1 Tax=Colletotrichum karsti TaxID=1095194 RepID=A0A9P6I7K1_9PEZI|nr:uncharacterized protein CkaCkLH20_05134 [Colletotrichum karsti]KAF9877434.1 hypothetical protein CkaCkLH20_05134 [Colletotrichum karsti]